VKFDNALTRMLGVKYPIIQGAFGWRGTGMSDIAVPVSEAGGLGILTTICYDDPDQFQQDLRKATSMTDKPIAVNFTITKGPRFNADYHAEYVRITLEENVGTIFTSAYDASGIGLKFKAAGRNWIHKCATLKHALSIAGKGVDAVVIVGLEGTGHKNPDQHTTLINITNLRRMIAIPIIAAGGIGDARGFLAALAMGASGVYMGTAFMATQEFRIAQKVKEAIVHQRVTDMEYSKKIYQMQRSGLHSLASGVIDTLPTVREFIERIIEGAEEIAAEFKQWGMLQA